MSRAEALLIIYDPYFNDIKLVDTPEDFIEIADTQEFTKRRLYGRNTK